MAKRQRRKKPQRDPSIQPLTTEAAFEAYLAYVGLDELRRRLAIVHYRMLEQEQKQHDITHS